LNTAAAWLFSAAKAKKLSKTVADRSCELKKLIAAGEVTTLNLFYCHNCKESQNVADELETVRESVVQRLKAEGLPNVQVSAVEYGLDRLQSILETDPNKLFVNETIEIDFDSAIYQSTDEWRAITTTVEGQWLKELFERHQAKLFAANFRDFLGASRRRRDINAGIKRSIEKEPDNFWIYNNGITLLCNKLVKKKGKYVIAGVAVVNGAQTTGSFGECIEPNEARVLARFIRCKRGPLVHNIIKFNNTQNEIKPSDTRANDHVQVKLKNEFEELGVTYLMRRSGGRAPDRSVISSVVGVSLAAFHGYTQLAARNSADIFLVDEDYGRVFRNDLTARHVAVVLALSSAIDKLKRYLKDRVDVEEAAPTEAQTYEALRYSMSKHFMMSTIGRLSGDIVGTKIASLYKLELRKADGNSIQSLESAWYDVLRDLLPFIGREIHKIGEPYDVTRDVSNVGAVANECAAAVGLVRSTKPKAFQKLKSKIY
jgi:AIPR protein